MAAIEILDVGQISPAPVTGLACRNASFPSLVGFPDGHLVCAMDLGGLHSVDCRSYVCHSTDGGKTWGEPGLIFEPDARDYPVDTSVRISRLPSGELLGLACLFHRREGQSRHFNPETEGSVTTQLALIRSVDRGHTWQTPALIPPPVAWDHFEICSPVVPLSGGRLLAPTSFLNDWDGNCSFPRYSAIAFRSDDGGATWPDLVQVMNLSSQRLTGWEQKLTVLSDGRVMAMCWCFDFVAKASQRNRYAVSTDNGRTFGPSIESPIHGETNTILALPERHVLSMYRRVDRRGLWSQLARIDGEAWVPLVDRPVWGSDEPAYQDPSRPSQSSNIWKRMSTLRFGCPTMVPLLDREILAAFWAQEGDGPSVIHWLRLKWNL